MTPDFQILADDVDVTDHIRRNLVSLRITDKDGIEADQIEIEISDPTNAIALPPKGAVLRVAIGWRGQELVDKGEYTVDEVGENGPPNVINITGRAADFRQAIKDSRDTSYHDTTLGAVLETVASRNGLSAAIHPDLAAAPIPHLDQTTESDVNLITRLAEDYGAVGTIKTGNLVFVPRGSGQTASGATLPTVQIARRDGDRHTFRATDRDGAQTGVKARWHDYQSAETKTSLAGAEGSVRTLKRTYGSEAEAKAAAEASVARQKSQAHEFTVSLAVGRPDVLACAPLELSGWRDEITELTWVIGTVTHALDGAGGYTTDVSATAEAASDDDGTAATAAAGTSTAEDDLTWVDAVPSR